MTLAHKILGQITVDSTSLGPVDPKPFVAVSSYSMLDYPVSTAAAVSTDAITWTASTLPASAGWSIVTFGGGKFVAVAKDAASASYSTDGITWTTAAFASSGDWQSATYGGGRFVVVERDSDTTAYSTDAITWTQTTLPSSFSSYFDGANWIETTIPEYVEWKSVTYGDGKFVAVADGSTKAAYSTDAITWTKTTMPSSSDWSSVTHGGGTYVAVAKDSTTTAYSTDAITWTASTLPASSTWTSVAYGDGKFVAVANYNYSAAVSTDGITWTASSPDLPNTGGTSVAYSGSTFAVVSGNGNLSQGWNNYSAYSTDGMTWTDATLPSSYDSFQALSGGDVNYQGIGYTAPQTIYTVPSSTEAIVSSIFISNTSTTTDTYNFAVVPSGETLSDIHYIRKNTDIVAKDFHNIDTKITMSAGDSLVALSGAADKLNINVFGVEKS